MGRKRKTSFEWTADDPETATDLVDEAPGWSRAAEKRRRRRLETLAEDMAAMSAGNRKRLPMDDEMKEALEGLVVAGKTPNRRRKLLRMKSLLAEEEEEVIDALIDAVAHP